MTKKKKFPTKAVVIGSLLSILFLGVIAVGANYSFMDRIADKAGEVLGLNLSDQIKIDMPEETFGGSGGVFQTDWYKIGNRVTYVKSGSFKDATTTIVAFTNPFGTTASSTVVSVNLDITGVATTTYTIACGASTDVYTDNSYSILSSGSIVTSTVAVIENNLTNSYSNGVTGGTVAKMALTPEASYFVCKVTTKGTAFNGAFTGEDNTFDGSWSVEIEKNL